MVDTDINIVNSFKHEGGMLHVELKEKNAEIIWDIDGKEYIVEDSFGQIADWAYLYLKKWRRLFGAALTSSEKKFAKDYAIASLEDWKDFIKSDPDFMKESSIYIWLRKEYLTC